MKHLTLSPLRRFALTVVALLFVSLYANAYETYYAFYTKVSAYPSGKGQVYLSASNSETPTDDQYQDAAEEQVVDLSYTRYVYAKPAPGYIFAGLSQDSIEYSEFGEVVDYHYSGVITSWGNPASLTYKSDVSGDEEEQVRGNMPMDPNGSFNAVFTRVVVGLPAGQDALGTVSIDKVANEIGDQVTMKATPKKESCHFVNWTLNGKVVSNNRELTITVSDSARYIAHFTGDSAFTVNFPAEGGYIQYYNYDCTLKIPEGTEVRTFDVNYVDKTGPYVPTFTSVYQIPRDEAAYIYGKGEVTFTFEEDELYAHDNLLDRWSGDNGVSVDTLDPRNAYYIADMEAEKMTRVTGVIAPKQIYVSVPDSFFTTAPEVIFFSEEAAQNYAAGIGTVKPVDVKGLGRIYTIEGREVALPEENKLYIIDGKKVIYRKK